MNQLHSAERDSDVTEMKYTLPLGFSVDSRDAGGRTPLMNAALYVNFQAVKNLIKRGADPSLVDNGGWNSLHFAAKGGDTDIIALIHSHLLKIGSKTGEGYTPLMVAAFSGKLNAVEWFLEKGATVSCVDNTEWNTLHYAAQGGDTDIISLIHTHLPNIESKTGEGLTPLMLAAFCGKLHVVKWFLEKGATVTSVGSNRWNVLHFAAQGGDPDTIDLILTHLPDIESKTADGKTPLIIAVLHGKLQGVKCLLERGANPSAKDNDGQDSLHHASSLDSDIFDLLLSHVP